MQGRAIGFTGSGAGAYAGDRVGRVGDIVYAVQGNVLTGAPVLAAIEIAIYTTPGDLAEKLMASMEAARQYGGDGRCSCSGTSPDGCGSPPPSFTKSSHVAFMVVSRPGDADGAGYADGAYYLDLDVANQQPTDPDPVITLRGRFHQWQNHQRGRPDQFRSTVAFDAPTLPHVPGPGVAGTVTLRDREGTRITHGGAAVTVARVPTSPSDATIGPVTDNGDGSYSFVVTAGVRPGRLDLRVTVDDGSGARPIFPAPVLADSAWPLWVNRAEISATAGGAIDFAVQPGSRYGASSPWILLASASGTSPGIRLSQDVNLALNPDPLFDATVLAVQCGVMPELYGVMSPSGLDATRLSFPPGLYTIPVGTQLSFAFTVLDPQSLGVLISSNAVTVRVVP